MYSILLKEINSFLNSLIGYVVIGIFLVGVGLFVWVYPESNVLDTGFADLQVLFDVGPFVFIFLIPAITMRTFSEERKTGTMELLLTRPLTDLQIIGGKYFASLLLVIFAILPTLLYYFTLYNLGNPAGNIDSAAVAGSYLGMVLLGAVFVSVGLFASALFDNQIVAFIVGAFLCYTLYQGISSLVTDVWAASAPFLNWVSLAYHYSSLGKGLIDSRDLVYFASLISLMLGATRLSLQSRNW